MATHALGRYGQAKKRNEYIIQMTDAVNQEL